MKSLFLPNENITDLEIGYVALRPFQFIGRNEIGFSGSAYFCLMKILRLGKLATLHFAHFNSLAEMKLASQVQPSSA